MAQNDEIRKLLDPNRAQLEKEADIDRQSGPSAANVSDIERRRLALGELPVSTLVLGIAVSLLLLGYLAYQFKRRLTSKPQPVDTNDLPTDLESGLTLSG